MDNKRSGTYGKHIGTFNSSLSMAKLFKILYNIPFIPVTGNNFKSHFRCERIFSGSAAYKQRGIDIIGPLNTMINNLILHVTFNLIG